MRTIYLVSLTLTVCLSACGGGSGDDPSTGASGNLTPGTTTTTTITARAFTCESDPANPLVGCWTRERCVKNTIGSMQYDSSHRSDVVSFLKDGTVMDHERVYGNTTCSGTPLEDRVFGSGSNPNKITVLEPVTLSDGLSGHYVKVSESGANPSKVGYGVFAISAGRLCFDDAMTNTGSLIPIINTDSGVFKKEDVSLRLDYAAQVVDGVVRRSSCFTSGNL